jgi:Protein of unknown function (DUF3309)
MALSTVFLIILILALLGALPSWPTAGVGATAHQGSLAWCWSSFSLMALMGRMPA